VSNTRGVQATPIAEHVFATVLALAKQLPFALENQQRARWAQNEFTGPRLPWLLRGRTLGLIGAGTIGSEIARMGAAFGMTVIATRRRAAGNAPGPFAEILPPSAIDSLLARADVLVIAAPLTPETESLIGAAQIGRLRPGALLVNVGRAKIVDTDALVDALRSGHLGGAALDVFPREPLPSDHPLWTTPNVILTPHTSGFRQGHWDEVIDLFAENLRRFEQGREVRFRVHPDLGY
jgi:phosphoglycerate dehydrogenase-like enzyme